MSKIKNKTIVGALRVQIADLPSTHLRNDRQRGIPSHLARLHVIKVRIASVKMRSAYRTRKIIGPVAVEYLLGGEDHSAHTTLQGKVR